ncbi:uncharacterized protein LOC124166503 [Ischnura elegans]|uniref:uncharacterized protein LOC124166503 n=1 Tax=Ischnura elegans TaxID=197161 RepID=UPI001ED8768F|nr:uncharacterized protein LOC124166503 [Ischnura elegans]
MRRKSISQVLLSTAVIQVRDKTGRWVNCRALLDSGSQTHFITEHCAQLLGAQKKRKHIPLQGFNSITSSTTHSVDIEIKSITTDFTAKLNCAVLPKITGNLPTTLISCKKLGLPRNIQLADPTFNEPQKINILIGVELFCKLLLPEQNPRPGPYPVLQNTKLGWILSGEYKRDPDQVNLTQQLTLLARSDSTLEQQLSKWWDIEEMEQPVHSKEEQLCEQHFTTHTVRDDNGRFIVRLPTKNGTENLGDSRETALLRFYQIERRLERNIALKKDYTNFMQEYEELGHMILSTEEGGVNYYLPHHPVFKEVSSTTRLRVVFDASTLTTNGTLLNDMLLVGPTIQQDLWSIAMRFRFHPVALTTDISKMYRQILMHPEDQGLQRVLWRKDPNEDLREYKLTTVTYGTAAAPFLAVKCLQELAMRERENYPEAAEVLTRDFYVDNGLTGSDTPESAIKLQRELQELLELGGFQLRKWCSNDRKVLEAIPTQLKELNHSLADDDSQMANQMTAGAADGPEAMEMLVQRVPTYITTTSEVDGNI